MTNINPNPSLCIPRIFDKVNRRDIQTIFDKLDLGKISHIDVIERKTEKGQSYKRVFIHFYNWYTYPIAHLLSLYMSHLKS